MCMYLEGMWCLMEFHTGGPQQSVAPMAVNFLQDPHESGCVAVSDVEVGFVMVRSDECTCREVME